MDAGAADRLAAVSAAGLLRAWGGRANKRYGQNFLADPRILDRIVGVAALRAGERVLEIGPGAGGLTLHLLRAGALVTALEADRGLVAFLREAFAGVEALRIVEGSALDASLEEALGDPPAAVVANLPYNAATEILFRLVDRVPAPRSMTLMFQREVAERIVAPGASRDFGLLALHTSMRWTAEIALTLPPGAFIPPPRVHSAVVALAPRATPMASPEMEARALRIARSAFGQRRKTLRNSLRALAHDVEPWLARAGISPTARPEELMPADFVRLAESGPAM